MRTFLAVAFLFVLSGLPAAAGVIDQHQQVSITQPKSMKIDAVGYPHVIVTVYNHGGTSIGAVTVDCAFLDKARDPIGTGGGYTHNVSAGARAFINVTLIQVARPTYAECRISQAYTIQ
jgi:hypothetical protein